MPNGWFSQPVYLTGGDPENVNDAVLQYPGQLGIRFSYITPPRSAPSDTTGQGTAKTYKLVKTDSTMATAPYEGAVAWFSNQAQHVVTTALTALGRGRLAGVFRCSVTPGNYTCVQVKGLGTVKFVDAPTAAPTDDGFFVIPSGTVAKADCLAAGSAATYPAIGRSAGALIGGTALGLVDIDVPEVL
jgi:hypothetical protein